MTLSRTARFLILFLLLAAAAFVWVNFFLQDRAAETVGPSVAGAEPVPAPLQAGLQSGDAIPSPEGATTPAEGTEPVEGDAGEGVVAGTPEQPVVAAEEPVAAVEEPTGTAEEPTATLEEPLATPVVPTVIAPGAQSIVERELVVAEFPFLITEPPATTTAGDGDDGDTVLRPQTQRASINPFSPVLVQVPAAAATPVATVTPPTTQPNIEVVAVEIPGAPALPQVRREPVVETVVAPTPRPLTPPSPRAQGLPRQLPGGTLPVAPDILQTTRVVPQVIEVEPVVEVEPVIEIEVEAEVVRPRPEDIAAAAVIREPNDTIAADLAAVGTATDNGAALPGLLGPAAIVAEAEAGTDTGVTAAPVGTVPLAAGTNLLSRYLRDNGFAFTGTVLGPVSVGVFTSPLFTTPVVVALGQTLPDTEIVLTDLRGQQAEFSLDDATQVLTLDLRR